MTAALLAAAALAVLSLVLSSGAGGGARVQPSDAALAGISTRATGRDMFKIRLSPMVGAVGRAGWCVIVEEHGKGAGSACGNVPTPSQPFLQVFGWSEVGAPYETEAVVTDPQITAVLVDNRRRVATTPLPGLPYGLRGARVIARPGSTLVAIQADGRRLAERWVSPAPQASVLRWRHPHSPPGGVCGVRASGLTGLAVRGGAVATSIRPYPGQIIGHAFVPCLAIEYELHNTPLKAIVLLDAARPQSFAPLLPDFHAVRGSPGVYAEGELTAKRSGAGWIVVEQGTGVRQRMLLLRHLTAAQGAGAGRPLRSDPRAKRLRVAHAP
ncbi:MAG TPA: hypothetical protein VGN08_01210 [Solirubrobacteraceae bacterium]